jgi:8-oxoguanine DNA glycosylase, N-terminal domain
MRPTSVLLHLSAAVSSFKSLARAPWIRTDYLKISSTSQGHMTTISESTSLFDNIIDGARWIDLEISPTELRPNYTLIMGQCFNWKRIDNADTDGIISTCWIGILGTYPLAIRQTDETTLFANLMDSRTVHALMATSSSDKLKKIELTSTELTLKYLLRNYFQTDHSLESLYISWANGCNRMLAVTEALKGVRVVRQDPFECEHCRHSDRYYRDLILCY